MSASLEAVWRFFERRRRSYQLTFSRTSPHAMAVLGDLEDFCCAGRTTMNSTDPLELARNEGRRQVWMRITKAIALTPDEQIELAMKKDKPQ